MHQKKEDEINRKMDEEYKRALVVEREKEKQRWEESVRYQVELEKQLTEKEKRKQEAYEEFLKEKLMIDEIVRKIYEEDQRFEKFTLLFFKLLCGSHITERAQ